MVHTPVGSSPQHLTVLKAQSWKPASDLYTEIYKVSKQEFDKMFMQMRYVRMTDQMDICLIKLME